MKMIVLALACGFLSACAYIDGVRHEKNVIPAPAGAIPATSNQSQAVANQAAAANVNAAKQISAVTH